MLGLLVGALLSTKTIDVGAEQVRGKGLITVNFQDTDLRVVIKFISELTGKNFIVDSKVKGQVTVISPTKITIEEAYRMFESILEVEGYTTVPAGPITKIVPAREAKSSGIDTIPDWERRALRGEQFVTRIIHMNYIDADSVTPVIKPLLSRESSLVTYAYTNDIILTDSIPNVRKVLNILEELDVEGYQVEISVLPLQFASAKELASELLSIFEIRPAPAPRPARPARRAQTPAVTGVSTKQVVKIIPDDRTNSLVVVASADDTRQIRSVVEKLDVPPPKGKGRINVVYLKNADGEELAQTLKQITAAGQKVAAPGQKRIELAGDVVITPDKATNSLVITASPQDFEVLKAVIEYLDIRRLQVFVEGVIMEVRMDKLRDLGVEFKHVPDDLAKDSSEASTSVFGATTFETPLENPFSTQGLILGAADGTITFGGVTFLNVGALIRALQTETDANILFTPHLLTTDNEEAELVVAENVPFLVRTTATASGFPVEEIERKDVGVVLRLTPQISEGDFVKLNIYQEVSNVQPAGTVEGAVDLTTLVRSAKTTVVVRDHQTVVIGGLVSDDHSDTVNKVPWLGDVPLLGYLFRANQKKSRKVSLLIILTPHIIRTSRDLEGFYKEKRDRMGRFLEESAIAEELKADVASDLWQIEPEEIIQDEGLRE